MKFCTKTSIMKKYWRIYEEPQFTLKLIKIKCRTVNASFNKISRGSFSTFSWKFGLFGSWINEISRSTFILQLFSTTVFWLFRVNFSVWSKFFARGKHTVCNTFYVCVLWTLNQVYSADNNWHRFLLRNEHNEFPAVALTFMFMYSMLCQINMLRLSCFSSSYSLVGLSLKRSHAKETGNDRCENFVKY